MKAHVTLLMALLVVLATAGCNTFQPHGLPQEFGGAAQQLSTSITEKASWERMLGRLDGQVIEPGLETFARVEWTAGARIAGMSGQVRLEGDGSAPGETSELARATIVGLTSNPDLLDKLLAALGQHGSAPPAGGE